MPGWGGSGMAGGREHVWLGACVASIVGRGMCRFGENVWYGVCVAGRHLLISSF